MLNKMTAYMMQLFRFVIYVFQRFTYDKMQPRAASLTFTSLLAIVPLLAISFAIFAAFPAFEDLKTKAHSFIFQNFVPEVGDVVQGYLEGFTAKAQGGLSAIGIIFLAVTSIMLLLTISRTFNDIWRARQPRSILVRLLVFWAILTLGPIFLGANISITSAVIAYSHSSGLSNITGPIQVALFIPFFIQAVGFTCMFLLIPNYPVRKRDALIGGFLAAILLESLKKGFTFYVTSFPTYETIYGAMATIPIFLIWIYLSWIVILFSAQFTAALPEWRAGTRRIDQDGMSLVERLCAILALLHALKKATELGRGLTERQLPIKTRLGPEQLVFAIYKLEDMNFITKADNGRWHLSRDLQKCSLQQFVRDLGLNMAPHVALSHLGDAWGHRLQQLIEENYQAGERIFETNLADLLEDMREEENFELTAQAAPAQKAGEVAGPTMFLVKILALIGIGISSQ